MNKSMWQMLKEECNNNPWEIIKTILQLAIMGTIGATWFYLMALGVLLIGG